MAGVRGWPALLLAQVLMVVLVLVAMHPPGGAAAGHRDLHDKFMKPGMVQLVKSRQAKEADTSPATDTTSETDESTAFTTAETATTTTVVTTTSSSTNEEEALRRINEMEAALRPLMVAAFEADWLEATDHTTEHAEAANEAYSKYSTAYSQWWTEVISFYEYEAFDDQELIRRFALQASPGTTALPAEDQTKLNMDLSSMNELALNKLCPYDNQGCDKAKQGYSMDELEGVLASERSWDALVYYWEEWRNVAGAPTKPYYVDFVRLMNKAAVTPGNDFKDAGQMWLQPYTAPDYTTDDFKTEVDELWTTMEPLYVKLHAYVRYRLLHDSPYKDTFGEKEPIPAHILGNMWAQSWENIYDLVAPYDEELINIDNALEDNIKNVTTMFKYAENFFEETQLFGMTDKFWANSMLEQPGAKVAVCHASAWDFLSVTDEGPQVDGDFRIKMCTDKNQEDFIVIHHEMGHTQYQMAYSQRENSTESPPLVFRDGANPGFHEAIGDTIALSVSTPSHLQGLFDDITGSDGGGLTTNSTYKRDINQLMKVALAKVAFIPYAYILDKFRWNVFSGQYSEDEYNLEWWNLRVEVQGLQPPVLRDADADFDPGCKYHVANGVPYIRYFVAHILQFQFHERLCDVKALETGNTTEVYECDIYGSKAAGELLRSLLERGNSVPWTDQLADFMDTEEGRMNSSSILAYFKPLEDFLDDEIERLGLPTAWEKDVDRFFVQHVPATVPIVVGVVLAAMIIIVVIAYFVGKNRQDKKAAATGQLQSNVSTAAQAEDGKVNAGFDMTERKASASSSSSSSSDEN